MPTSPDASLAIRDADADDAAALAALLTELGHPTSPEELAARLPQLVAGGDHALVATRGGAPLGLLTTHATPTLHRPRPVGRITALVVAEAERGRGVGRALVEAAERRLTARGCGMVEVTSNRQRTDAHAFYERLGYAITSYRFMKPLATD
jgi:GNAT superfamily N-acetyltransferase